MFFLHVGTTSAQTVKESKVTPFQISLIEFDQSTSRKAKPKLRSPPGHKRDRNTAKNYILRLL